MDSINIKLRFLTDLQVDIKINSSSFVIEIKEFILKKFRINYYDQILYFNETPLYDDDIISSHNIIDGSIIDILWFFTLDDLRRS